MDLIERIDRATTFAAEKVKGVAGDQLSKPTPCSEFDVRSLLNHVIGGLAMLTTAARGEKGAMPEGDQFGSDPGADYERRRTELIAALGADGVLDRNWEMPFATMPGAVMASIAFMEHLTHAWDVAKATGQDTVPGGSADPRHRFTVPQPRDRSNRISVATAPRCAERCRQRTECVTAHSVRSRRGQPTSLQPAWAE